MKKPKCQAPDCASPARRWYGWNANKLTGVKPPHNIRAMLCAPCSRALATKLGGPRFVIPLSTAMTIGDAH